MRGGSSGRALGLPVVLAVAAGVCFDAGRPAHAFVRSRTDAGKAFYWREGCVPATIYPNGFDQVPGGYTVEEIGKSVALAAHAWSPDGVTCAGASITHPYLEIVPTLAGSGKPPDAVWDSKNSIIFRTEQWSKSGKPGKAYLFDALAVTTVTARLNGAIVDADIEINTLSKAWLNLDPGVTPPFDQGATVDFHDLQNALTHEFGHFLGLDHTCYNPASGKLRPQDEQGQTVPDCDDAPASVRRTVMFDSAQPGETSKRTLSDDDASAVCEIYAPDLDVHTCNVDQPDDGCAVAGARPAGRGRTSGALALGLAAVGGLVLAAARRRRGAP